MPRARAAYDPPVRRLSWQVRTMVPLLASLAAAHVVVRAWPQSGALTPAPPAAQLATFVIEAVGALPAPVNPTSPVVAGNTLILVDQAGRLLRREGRAAVEIFKADQAPQGLKLAGNESIANAAASADGRRLFVMFTSLALPRGVPERRSPRPGADAWHVLYEYAFDGQALTRPRAIVALQMRTDGHSGGGMAVLADGSVLFGTGDNGDSGEDGLTNPQDARNHLGKILRINPSNGTVAVVALGVRNPQRLDVGLREGEVYVDFADMGGSVSDELNSIRLTDLLQAGRTNNFGWGRNPDGRAREGSFYIDRGGVATGRAPADEAGFIGPVSELRPAGRQGFGIAGTVSPPVVTGAGMLAADLVSGDLFASPGSRTSRGQPIATIALATSSGRTTLRQLAGNERPDPRLFYFPDGSPGVLLEKTGELFRLIIEVHPGDPGPQTIAQDRFFISNDTRLHYVEQGTGDAVILLHELDGSAASFLRSGVFRNLASTHRVIALDARGHGLSDKPHESSAYGTDMADDVVRLMDRLAITRAHIVGYSMGTEVAAMLLMRAPERVRSVAFIAGAGRFRWLPTDDQHMAEEALEYENFGVSPKLFLEQTPVGTPDPTMEDLKRRSAVALADPLRDVKALAAFSLARRSRLVDQARLAAVTTPMVGIAGSLDPELETLKVLKGLRSDLEIVTVPDATHAGEGRILDRQECLVALRAFLSRAANRLPVDKGHR